jgi:hypothetical protein
MGKQLDSLNDKLTEFIGHQKMFFIGTAGREGKINLSPKGMDTFRILDNNRALWLNLTGSGNETAAHLLENGRITVMFCAFEGQPLILRLYGHAKVFHQRDPEWAECIQLFPDFTGSRQLIDIHIEMVQTSCGFGVPLYEFKGQREELRWWSEKKGEEGIKAYWKEKNTKSLDGKETGIF